MSRGISPVQATWTRDRRRIQERTLNRVEPSPHDHPSTQVLKKETKWMRSRGLPVDVWTHHGRPISIRQATHEALWRVRSLSNHDCNQTATMWLHRTVVTFSHFQQSGSNASIAIVIFIKRLASCLIGTVKSPSDGRVKTILIARSGPPKLTRSDRTAAVMLDPRLWLTIAVRSLHDRGLIARRSWPDHPAVGADSASKLEPRHLQLMSHDRRPSWPSIPPHDRIKRPEISGRNSFEKRCIPSFFSQLLIDS